MTELSPEIERQLAALSDGEWAALTAKVRAPDTSESFRDIASTVVPDHALDEFMRCTNVAGFVGEDGKLDEPHVRQHLAVMFGAAESQGRDWGQSGQYAGSPGPGDKGRTEAERRQGKPPSEPHFAGRASGAQGRAEAERRKNRGRR